jgi:hypothetical protein
MPGVAWGAFIPASILSAGVVFPKTCRLVGLSVAAGYRSIVWPVAWPAVIAIATLVSTRHLLPPTLPFALTHLMLGGAFYATLVFAFGLDREERQWFIGAGRQIAARILPRAGLLAPSTVEGKAAAYRVVKPETGGVR